MERIFLQRFYIVKFPEKETSLCPKWRIFPRERIFSKHRRQRSKLR
jgi:hypothetical protein